MRELNHDIQGLRIGLPREYFNEDLDPDVRDRVMAALSLLEQAGATLVDIELPHSHYAIATYYVIAPCGGISESGSLRRRPLWLSL
jgi:aspartyl-tRNA(Asn)/glutamyl-tRNA(Gln) amidotransferase subunit A